jgi:formylmethanofuran dehydrogenase subunit A
MTFTAPVSSANLLIRGGYVLTMDSAGDLPGADVAVRDGVIQQVAANLDVPGAEVIDASGKIVAPGLVDTHWHMWNTLLRGMSDGRPSRVARPVAQGAVAPGAQPGAYRADERAPVPRAGYVPDRGGYFATGRTSATAGSPRLTRRR